MTYGAIEEMFEEVDVGRQERGEPEQEDFVDGDTAIVVIIETDERLLHSALERPDYRPREDIEFAVEVLI